MIRTQIYLPDEMASELKLLAQQLNTSMSETIRMALTKAIPQIKKKKIKNIGALDAIIDLAKTDYAPKDLSENIDEYLYGKYRIK